MMMSLNTAVNRAICDIRAFRVHQYWNPATRRLLARARHAALGLATISGSALAQPRIIVEKNVPARMRDGVVLRADVYRPDSAGRLPVLLQRTPYSKNPGREDNLFRRLAAHGYVVVVQDTRGRYTSDGVAKPHDEAEDGYDTIEWAAGMSFSNGRVGTFGGSYLATTQLLAAPLRPPHLVAIFPSSSYNSRYDMVFQGGAFYIADGLNWNLSQGADVRRRRSDPDANRDGAIGLTPDERRLFNSEWLWHLPLKSIEAMSIREYAPGYFAMLSHPSYDDYWRTFDVEARHGDFDVPAFHVTGWYDARANGTIRNFAGLRKNARSARARDGQRLIVGPWTHATPTLNTTTIGDVSFGAQAGFDSEALIAEWFDHWLKSRPTGVMNRAPVRLFVMGANIWRDEQEWPLARAVSTFFYLHSAGGANTLSGNGALTKTAPASESPDQFIYDPAKPVPTGARGGYSRAPSDQREVEQRADVLVYTSAPLDAALEVTGPISVELWAASSGADTDFTAKLVDVFPDGTARALTDGILRARYRKSKTTPVLLTPGQPERMTIDVGATSNVFLPGHRLRLEVSSSNFPRFDRNPNTGAPFGESAELRVATQTVLHDPHHPSRIMLPVVPQR
jgi:putative CocE/NonD family hydrolase